MWFRGWEFVASIGVTVIDLLLRPGFLPGRDADRRASQPRPRPLPDGWGIPICGIAAFLGVGGSVMTVSMMRRSGLDMGVATSLANPLTVAIAAPALVVPPYSAAASRRSLGSSGLSISPQRLPCWPGQSW